MAVLDHECQQAASSHVVCLDIRTSSVIPVTESKMSAALKLLLLAAGTLLVSAKPWNNYRSLPDSYRKHIDTALKEANREFGGDLHVAYESFYSTPQVSSILLTCSDCVA